MIVLSVVFVCVIGMSGRRPENWNLFAGVVLVFGLIRGLGLSTRL